jgi:hypothetical protein
MLGAPAWGRRVRRGGRVVPADDDPRKSDRDIEIDLEVAAPTRASTFHRGADGHFEVDRDVAARLYASHTGGIDAFRAVGAVAQAFLERVVRHLAGEVGLRQFLVMGSSVSGRRNVHEMVQEIDPQTRVVYVLFDPVMLVYAHRLSRNAAEGTTAFVRARMRDVDDILRQAAGTLDMSTPVGVLMPGNLSFVRDRRRAAAIVDGFMGGVAAGSHIMVSNHASDLLGEEAAAVYRAIAELAAEGRSWDVAPRSHDEVVQLLGALQLVDPGVVPIELWRPDGPEPPVRVAIHGAVARK